MSYIKPWTSIEDQLATLQSRGLGVTDREKALNCLQRIGYYRLSGYWFAFRQRSAVDGPLPLPTDETKKPKNLSVNKI